MDVIIYSARNVKNIYVGDAKQLFLRLLMNVMNIWGDARIEIDY